MRFFHTILTAAYAVLACNASKVSHLVDLTENSFEKLTQAATGATTGDWFVKFYAPWCGHCKRLEPTWEKLAEKVHGVANVARVDASKYRDLGRRFQVKGFPTLLFFSKGKMYEYEGERTIEALEEFIRGGFKDVEGMAVPAPPSMMDYVKKMAVATMMDFNNILRNEKGAALLIGVSGGVVGALCAGLIFSKTCSHHATKNRHSAEKRSTKAKKDS